MVGVTPANCMEVSKAAEPFDYLLTHVSASIGEGSGWGSNP